MSSRTSLFVKGFTLSWQVPSRLAGSGRKLETCVPPSLRWRPFAHSVGEDDGMGVERAPSR